MYLKRYVPILLTIDMDGNQMINLFYDMKNLIRFIVFLI